MRDDLSTILNKITGGKAANAFELLYGSNPRSMEQQKVRYLDLIHNFSQTFPGHGEIELFSTPGRTEVGGNHTDHNAGRVLAAAVDLDIVAAVAKNDGDLIRIRSEKFPSVEINIADLEVVQNEQFTPAALVRGICARLVQLGYKIGGFEAFTSSDVPAGVGLSSSAAFEVLIVTILNHLFNEGAIDGVLNAKVSQYTENVYFGKPSGLMDQTACALGGLIAIDFKDFNHPNIQKVDFDFQAQGFSIVIVDTGGDHSNLNEDYSLLQREMRSVARAMGGDVLREFSKDRLLTDLPAIRNQVSDRAILRAIHFYDDDQRVADQVKALESEDFSEFLKLVIDSGNSSWKLCQNIFSCSNVHEQGLAVALALSENMLRDVGAWRVHGGGFAGTIQAFVPHDMVADYITMMETVFGEGSCHQLLIQPIGTTWVTNLIK